MSYAMSTGFGKRLTASAVFCLAVGTALLELLVGYAEVTIRKHARIEDPICRLSDFYFLNINELP